MRQMVPPRLGGPQGVQAGPLVGSPRVLAGDGQPGIALGVEPVEPLLVLGMAAAGFHVVVVGTMLRARRRGGFAHAHRVNSPNRCLVGHFGGIAGGQEQKRENARGDTPSAEEANHEAPSVRALGLYRLVGAP